MKDSDENKYPLFLERFSGKSTVFSVDSALQTPGYAYNNSSEHLMFGVVAAAAVKAPREIVLYELSEVDTNELGNNEMLFP